MNNNIDSRYIKSIIFAFALIVAVFVFNSKVLNNVSLKNNQAEETTGVPMPAPVAISPEEMANNYLSNAVDASGGYSIWKTMPVSVNVQNNSFKDTVKQAFEAYNNTFAGILQFTFTDNANEAQIKVSFHDRLELSNSDQFVAGVTNNFSSGKDIQSSTIKLLTQKNGVKLSSTSIYNTALHEIGHVIGINGHSDDKGDVMYPQTDSINMAKFSVRDIATIKIMYSNNEQLISQNTASAGSEKLQEAIKYTQQVPNKTTGWINLGNVYYDLKMLPEALEAYKKALNIDPSDSNIYASMASCYYSSKKYDTAAQFYEYAKERTYDTVEIENYEAMIALSKLSGQHYEEAYNLYSNLVNKYPNKKDYFINYLYLCTYLKKPEGREKLQAFLQMHPEANSDPSIQQYKSYYKLN